MTQERDDAAGQHLLALDIDGTLLETGQKPVPLVVRTLAEVLAAGHVVVLATGRSLAGTLPVAAQLGMRDGWLITSNGAVTTRVRGGEARIVERHAVDAERVVRFLSPKARLRMAAEIPGHGYRVSDPFTSGELSGVREPSNLEGLWAAPTPRLALVGDAAAWFIDDLRAMGLTVNTPHPGWVDVTPGGVSKSSALERVRITERVSATRTIAVGDGGNDIDMLIWAAHGVAMGHAPSEVQEAADHVTGTLAEDGVVPVLALAATR